MDLNIKREPDIFENTNTQSSEFIKLTSNEQNEVNISGINTVNSATTVRQITNNGKVRCEVLKPPAGKKCNDISLHSKKMLLKAFQQQGCSRDTIHKYFLYFSYKTDIAAEYFTKAAKDAEDYTYQECNSLSFNNITEWLKYLKSIGAPQQCNYEAAIVLNAIAQNEILPESTETSGINLKSIYKFLSNALMGLPQNQLDEPSAKFLANEFQNLIDEANTDVADYEVQYMKNKIEESLACLSNAKVSSLDPLKTNDEQNEANIKQH